MPGCLVYQNYRALCENIKLMLIWYFDTVLVSAVMYWYISIMTFYEVYDIVAYSVFFENKYELDAQVANAVNR